MFIHICLPVWLVGCSLFYPFCCLRLSMFLIDFFSTANDCICIQLINKLITCYINYLFYFFSIKNVKSLSSTVAKLYNHMASSGVCVCVFIQNKLIFISQFMVKSIELCPCIASSVYCVFVCMCAMHCSTFLCVENEQFISFYFTPKVS